MPTLNKKDYTNHITEFFAEQGKKMTNLSKMSINTLEHIIKKHKIPDLNEDKIFQARIDKRREQSEAKKKKKNADIEGTEEYKAKKEKEEKERLEKEERDRKYKLGDMMRRILRTKLIKNLYKDFNHDERLYIWKCYINKKKIREWNSFQRDYDTAIIIMEDYKNEGWFIECNKQHEGSVSINCNGINTIVSHMELNKIAEPYMRLGNWKHEINPFE